MTDHVTDPMLSAMLTESDHCHSCVSYRTVSSWGEVHTDLSTLPSIGPGMAQRQSTEVESAQVKLTCKLLSTPHKCS